MNDGLDAACDDLYDENNPNEKAVRSRMALMTSRKTPLRKQWMHSYFGKLKEMREAMASTVQRIVVWAHL